MSHVLRHALGRSGFLWAMLVYCAIAAAQPAEPAPVAVPQTAVTLDLDYEELLKATDLWVPKVQDSLWVLTAVEGRRIIQIPIVFTSASGRQTVGPNTIKLSAGGRFLAWRVEPDPRRGVGVDPDAPAPAGTARASDNEPLPLRARTDPPRFTRDLFIEPDGSFKWTLDRWLATGTSEVVAGNPPQAYALLIRPDLLDGLDPGKAPIPKRNSNEDNAAYNARRRKVEDEHRVKVEAHGTLRRRVRQLPTQFVAEQPVRAWAVFDVRANAPELVFEGPAPLPWRVPVDALLAAGAAARGSVTSRDTLTPQVAGAFERMLPMVAAPASAPSLRLAARALVFGRALLVTQPEDVVFRLARGIIESDDSLARRIVVQELAAMKSMTPAAESLLRLAAQRGDGNSAVFSLRGLLKTNDRSPQALTQLADQANRLLADPNGPEVGDIVAALAGAAADQPALVSALLAGVKFDALAGARRDQALKALTLAAGSHALAAAWIDQVLAQPDAQAVAQSLRIIDQTLSAAAETVRPPVLPLSSARQPLIQLLNSNDATLRPLAWNVIARGLIVNPAAGENEPCRKIVEAALSQRPTPPQVVAFLVRQSEPARDGEALVRLVMMADAQVSAAAAKSLLGVKRPLDKALSDLLPEDRHAFAARCYQGLLQRQPLVVGLIREKGPESGALAVWLGRELAAGRVPDAAGWAGAFGDDARLLIAIDASDRKLGQAAAAALLGQVGGNDRQAMDLYDALTAQRDPAARQGILIQARQTVLVSKAAAAVGAYHMRVALYDKLPANFQGIPASSVAPVQTLDVGPVEVATDGKSVYLVGRPFSLGVPETHLALRIATPSELRNTANRDLARIPWNQAASPIDLLPQPDGSWRGGISLGGQWALVEFLHRK